MASYRAIQTGDWSDINTWEVWDGSTWIAASDIPDDDDDVWANSYTVTIDQDVTVLTIRNWSGSAPGTGNINSGSFSIITNDITLICLNTLNNNSVGTSNLLLISHTSGVVNIFLSFIRNSTSRNAINFFVLNGSGITNWEGNLSITGSNGGALIFSNGVLNFVGNLLLAPFTESASRVIIQSSGVINLTGDILNNNASTSGPIAVIVSDGEFNLTGNINNINTIAAQGIGISVGANSQCNITGNVLGGVTNAVSSSAQCLITHAGICKGGDANSFGQGSVAVNSSSGSSITILSGPFIFGSHGAMPFNCARAFLSNNTSNYIEFADDSTNGALFPNAAPTRETMYSPNTLADSPTESDVREGVTYALGSQTGTLAVPDPASVALNVPTDNTVGTAILTPEALFDAIENETHPMATRLKNVSTVQSTGDQLTSL
jgi:hypothetical protein